MTRAAHAHTLPVPGAETGFFTRLLDRDFIPRAHCFNEDPSVIWIHVVSDLIITVAYYSIPLALVYFVARRKDLAFNWMFLLFSAFILLCGTTHLFNIVAVWNPIYRLDGMVKAVTGVVSIATAAALWPLIPRAIALPSPSQLNVLNATMKEEILRRREAQEALQRGRDELERRVQERTAELAAANRELQEEIARRRTAQEELAQHRDRLEELVAARTRELGESHQRLRLTERLASLGTLTAGLGHDMGNLLLPVRAHLESVESAGLPAGTREDVLVIRRCVDHLQRLATGLRMFSKDPDERATGAEAVDVAMWWPDVEPFMKNAVPRNVRLRTDFDPNTPPVALAAHRLTQVVFNLVQNAGDAIIGAGLSAGNIRVWCRPAPGGGVQVGVTDDGPGMTEEVRRRCLEPFFSTKTRAISTGLGLALVHGIVASAGGSVQIDSAPGRGTTFTLTFPAAKPRAAQPTAVVSVADARTRSLLQGLLVALGYDARIETGPPVGPVAVWVTDATRDRAAAARELLARSPGARVVAIGEATEAWQVSGASVVPAGTPVSVLRERLALAVNGNSGGGHGGRN